MTIVAIKMSIKCPRCKKKMYRVKVDGKAEIRRCWCEEI